MKNIRLKSTGQPVFAVTWLATTPQPWPRNYTRVQRPFIFPEGSNSENKSEIMIVNDNNLEEYTI